LCCRCSVLQGVAVCLQCATVAECCSHDVIGGRSCGERGIGGACLCCCCNVLQRACCGSVLQWADDFVENGPTEVCFCGLFAVCCSVLQCVAMWGSVFQWNEWTILQRMVCRRCVAVHLRCVCIYIHKQIYIYTQHTHTHTYINIYVYVHNYSRLPVTRSMSICIYIHMHIYIYIHVCIHIRTCM